MFIPFMLVEVLVSPPTVLTLDDDYLAVWTSFLFGHRQQDSVVGRSPRPLVECVCGRKVGTSRFHGGLSLPDVVAVAGQALDIAVLVHPFLWISSWFVRHVE